MKIKLKNDALLALECKLSNFLNGNDMETWIDDRDLKALIQATLQEFHLKVRQMELCYKERYTLTLKPTWAFALRFVFAGALDLRSYEGVVIQRICDEVDKEFALLIK